MGGEKVGGSGGGGGAGAKKKRKVKGLSQHDATATDRSSPDNVSPSPNICLPARHPALVGQTTSLLLYLYLSHCYSIKEPIHSTYNLQHFIEKSFIVTGLAEHYVPDKIDPHACR